MNLTLAKTARFVIEDNEELLKKNFSLILKEDNKWTRLLECLANKELKITNNIDSFINEIKPLLKANSEDIDYEDIKSKVVYLINQAGLGFLISNMIEKPWDVDIKSDVNGEKEIDIQMDVPPLIKFQSIKRENLAWLIIIVTYIQSKNGKQSVKDFSSLFEKFTEDFCEQASLINPPINKSTQIVNNLNDASSDSQKKSLVLVFGFSYFASIDNINGKSNFDDNDIDWLINGVEWYWFGSDFEEIPSHPKGNVCLLKIDVTSNHPVIPGKIQLKNFLNGIKNKKIPLHQIKSNPGERYQLASFKDKGFRQ